MKRVILTGADGFIGRQAILPLLGRNYEVHAVSNRQPTADLRFENVVWHKTNLLDASEIEDLCRKIEATHLLHFAWYVEHGKFWNAPENEIWTEASVKLIENFNRFGGERIVVSGSCAEYEWGKDEVLHETRTPLVPQNFYGECKVKLQKKLAEISENQAWGRIFFLYGEHESPKRLIASVINSLIKNEFADCSHGRQIRDFLYVKDIADAFTALLDSKVQGAINIASGEARSIREIVLTAAEILEKIENLRFGIIPSPENEPKSIVADTRRLREEVGWQANYTLTEALTQTIEWWKKR